MVLRLQPEPVELPHGVRRVGVDDLGRLVGDGEGQQRRPIDEIRRTEQDVARKRSIDPQEHLAVGQVLNAAELGPGVRKGWIGTP